ncbi:AAA domain-containing protein [Tessaracoccus flavescens]|uniref:AAA+ ATPase domain-containing protein n=1 Tax=Tessaracoccus flavescens TaxID=399497 RepID=A0A1Q2D1L8_9ACTN|nr:AAA domain-containing protein [Tessaracoccus flavescens]AQP52203.1 hypothetical protein BW733_16630 [Tessaracoccus flavescens]
MTETQPSVDALMAPDDIFSGNLYVELPGDRPWERDDRKKLMASCADLTRRYPAIREGAQNANVTVEQYLLNTMFADLLPAQLSLAKLTFPRGARHIDIDVTMRLAGEARPGWPLPKGVSLVAKARWNLKGVDRQTEDVYPNNNPALRVWSFHDGPPGGARIFEVSLDVVCRQTARLEPGTRKQRNVLTQRLAEALPAISELTGERLRDWSDFLEWKRRLIQANREALRYTSRTLGADQRSVSFTIVGANAGALQQAIGRLARSDVLAAFDTSVSEDEWVFQLPEGEREPRGSDIGRKTRVRTQVRPAADPSGMPWDSPATAEAAFSLSDDALAAIETSGDPSNALGRALKLIPESGFIVQTAVQDLSQVNRQARALANLSDQGGYSPYLARYIFDAAEARTPSFQTPIDRWFNTHLNAEQRSAVQKVLSAPDLCLIQGPPGTGKTTVIAEAITQVAQRNESVLLASQTHTAVDNALSRLPFHPGVRAVRLTRNESRVSDEGQEFLNERALGRYYRSLANAVGEARRAAAAESEFATRLARFTQGAERQVVELRAAEERVRDVTSRYQSAGDQYLSLLQGLKGRGVAVPKSATDWSSSDSSADLLDTWLSDFEEAVPVLNYPLRILLGDRQPGPGSHGGRQRFELEAQLTTVVEKMKTDASLIEKWQRLQAELDGLPEDDENSALPAEKLVAYFPEAADLMAELQSKSLPPLKRLKYRKLARDLIRRIDEAAGLLPEANEQGDLRDDLRTELHSAERLVDQAQRNAADYFSSHRQFDFSLPAQPDRLVAADLDAQLQSLLSENSLRLAEASRQQQEGDAWSDIQDDWIADLGCDGVAERDWETIGDDWLAECNVVGVTCNENPRTLDDPGLTNFDLTIIDEVSKATPLEMLMPLMRARRSALVGDHRQLPPMFREGQDAEGLTEESDDAVPEELALTPENLKKYEKFVTASLFRTHFERADDSIRERLTVQHRMHPDIMDSVNRFYEGQLTCGINHPNDERAHGLTIKGRGDLPVISPDKHMVWIDTTHDDQGRAWTEPAPNSDKARTNDLEARLIVRMLRDIDDSWASDPANGGKLKEIGIVSMYQAQVRRIRQEINEELRNKPFKAIKYELNTVVKYQGKEKPIILVSMVRNFGPKASNRRRSSRANVARFEYINVAFSRAQELLVVFGARDTFAPYEVELPPMDATGSPTIANVYREICDVTERNGALKQASALGELPPTHAGATRR